MEDFAAISEMLAPGGYCLALIPNFYSRAFKILGVPFTGRQAQVEQTFLRRRGQIGLIYTNNV
jgi:hypothetical protein